MHDNEDIGSFALVGLEPSQRYRCDACGNVTRFDISVTETARRFWHADLSGSGQVDEEERATTIQQVQCRWCGATDIEVESRPTTAGQADQGNV